MRTFYDYDLSAENPDLLSNTNGNLNPKHDPDTNRTDVSTAVRTQHIVTNHAAVRQGDFLYSDLLSHPSGGFSSESSHYGSEAGKVPRRIAVVKNIRDKDKDVSYVSGSQTER